MTLYIDTTDFNQVTFAADSGKRIWKKSYKINPHESYETLSKLDGFLKLAKIKHDNIKKIIVNKGPGSFTGTRMGVTHALALGFAWKVPVKAVSGEQFVKLIAKSKS